MELAEDCPSDGSHARHAFGRRTPARGMTAGSLTTSPGVLLHGRTTSALDAPAQGRSPASIWSS